MSSKHRFILRQSQCLLRRACLPQALTAGIDSAPRFVARVLNSLALSTRHGEFATELNLNCEF
ncbi:MAG: hypothetical protein QOC96_3538 [Acidobacteriota bacterium]|nr:hypothetical protein [Acidobacteriota bacterium]